LQRRPPPRAREKAANAPPPEAVRMLGRVPWQAGVSHTVSRCHLLPRFQRLFSPPRRAPEDCTWLLPPSLPFSPAAFLVKKARRRGEGSGEEAGGGASPGVSVPEEGASWRLQRLPSKGLPPFPDALEGFFLSVEPKPVPVRGGCDSRLLGSVGDLRQHAWGMSKLAVLGLGVCKFPQLPQA
jgi:hypothetical protein